ncbi:hypothetical protein PB2503_09154 [Parvularcula bermudensis HTCC2503]|uniref:Alginate export domain-containing protein n=1 Tax=Parvularcula bermudensis (strain ATCC BAA-594 / HTCC2503 / KCTC 12087) TaxID=314260 RepID=E0TCU5_PARBH|nr:alginate export family protein [Parvularcula bermudensis]ADM09884.1 hypothetical protein PB2503_09154 [Parvularcula bermudensis HTCC2503]
MTKRSQWSALLSGGLCAGGGLLGAAQAEPVRLADALGGGEAVQIEGETRFRYESLDGQFRQGRTGSDQLLAIRTLLKGSIDLGLVRFGGELQDSRTYLDDRGTPLSVGFVNALDLLQLYAKVEGPRILGPQSETEVTLGRQTIAIGSRRQIARFDFANVIRPYTGVHWVSTTPSGDEFHAVLAALVDRRPTDREGLRDNTIVADQEQWNRRFWALHYRRADIAPTIVDDLWGEVYLYGFDETDTDGTPTANRHYVTPGARLLKAPVRGQWDLDLEGAVRLGKRRATTDPTDTEDLDTRASFGLARLGYTFDAPWSPHLAVQYYYASGDETPGDDDYGQYERLFNGRRGDLNNTSLHGPLTPANLSAPGVRFSAKPSPRTDMRLHYSAAFLASDTDSFVIAGYRDQSGSAGAFMGHTLDTRVRYWLVPGNVRLEVGTSAFLFGEFLDTVEGGPEGDRTLFGYGQLTFHY